MTSPSLPMARPFMCVKSNPPFSGNLMSTVPRHISTKKIRVLVKQNARVKTDNMRVFAKICFSSTYQCLTLDHAVVTYIVDFLFIIALVNAYICHNVL